MPGFTWRDRLQVGLLLASMVPFVATVLLGFESHNPLAVAISTGLAISSAGFALAWGTESMQFMVSQALALAVLALVQVLPEYSVEVVLAYKGATDPTLLHYATAAMTGANRLLLGLGWPAVFVLSSIAARRSKVVFKDLVLEDLQSVEIFFLGVATLYSFIIVAEGTLGVVDAAVLLAIFGIYVYIASRLPPHGEERLGEVEGPARAVSSMKGLRRVLAMVLLVALGASVIALGSEPFVTSFLTLARGVGLNQYLLIQWLTPVLTELPEAVTVFYWAARTGKGALALANLISSKLNQWTILVATIPIVYSIALGGFSSISLTQLQTSEILLTASQSFFGFTCLLDLRLSRFDAAMLFGLFLVQFIVPPVRLEVSLAYILLAFLELFLARRRLVVVSNVSRYFREHLH